MSKFNCSQPEFAESCHLVYSSLNEKILNFGGFKAFYDPQYVTDRDAEVSAAEALPDEEARAAVHQILRIRLEKSAAFGREIFQALKRYIESAFPPEEQAIRFNEAGQANYEKATHLDWEANKKLLIGAKNFVATHSVALLANNNMPATFEASIQPILTTVSNDILNFYNARENAKVGAQTKQNAFEDCHDDFIQVCKDGQFIFAADPAVRDQFTFSTVLELIRGAGIAGLRGYVTDFSTGLPIANCKVQLLGTTTIVFTDANGRYEIKPINAGEHNFQFTAGGYDQLVIIKEIIIGTVSSLSVQLITTP